MRLPKAFIDIVPSKFNDWGWSIKFDPSHHMFIHTVELGRYNLELTIHLERV